MTENEIIALATSTSTNAATYLDRKLKMRIEQPQQPPQIENIDDEFVVEENRVADEYLQRVKRDKHQKEEDFCAALLARREQKQQQRAGDNDHIRTLSSLTDVQRQNILRMARERHAAKYAHMSDEEVLKQLVSNAVTVANATSDLYKRNKREKRRRQQQLQFEEDESNAKLVPVRRGDTILRNQLTPRTVAANILRADESADRVYKKHPYDLDRADVDPRTKRIILRANNNNGRSDTLYYESAILQQPADLISGDPCSSYLVQAGQTAKKSPSKQPKRSPSSAVAASPAKRSVSRVSFVEPPQPKRKRQQKNQKMKKPAAAAGKKASIGEQSKYKTRSVRYTLESPMASCETILSWREEVTGVNKKKSASSIKQKKGAVSGSASKRIKAAASAEAQAASSSNAATPMLKRKSPRKTSSSASIHAARVERGRQLAEDNRRVREMGILPRARVSKSTKANLVFPVARVLRKLKQKLTKKKKPRVDSAVYTASVLEFLTAEIATVAGNEAIMDKRKRITPRHIFLGIKNDDELNEVFNKAIIPGGGTIKPVDMAQMQLEMSAEKKKRTAKKKRTTTKRPRKVPAAAKTPRRSPKSLMNQTNRSMQDLMSEEARVEAIDEVLDIVRNASLAVIRNRNADRSRIQQQTNSDLDSAVEDGDDDEEFKPESSVAESSENEASADEDDDRPSVTKVLKVKNNNKKPKKKKAAASAISSGDELTSDDDDDENYAGSTTSSPTRQSSSEEIQSDQEQTPARAAKKTAGRKPASAESTVTATTRIRGRAMQ